MSEINSASCTVFGLLFFQLCNTLQNSFFHWPVNLLPLFFFQGTAHSLFCTTLLPFEFVIPFQSSLLRITHSSTTNQSAMLLVLTFEIRAPHCLCCTLYTLYSASAATVYTVNRHCSFVQIRSVLYTIIRQYVPSDKQTFMGINMIMDVLLMFFLDEKNVNKRESMCLRIARRKNGACMCVCMYCVSLHPQHTHIRAHIHMNFHPPVSIHGKEITMNKVAFTC